MATSVLVLLWFCVLTLALVATCVGYRTALVLGRKTPANSWTRNAPTWQDPAWVKRCEHAHANCLENLPLYAALVLAAALSEQLALVDGLAWIYLGFRLAQVGVHLISTSPGFVFARANMLAGQWACLIYWLIQLLS